MKLTNNKRGFAELVVVGGISIIGWIVGNHSKEITQLKRTDTAIIQQVQVTNDEVQFLGNHIANQPWVPVTPDMSRMPARADSWRARIEAQRNGSL
jgi:hypothetical protein